MNKRFSIIIPVYNGEKTILRALASLISNRDYIYEVIVVNDHSNDHTVERVKELQDILPIKIIENTGNHNPGAARKCGILEAQGEWITFLDCDDCLTASALYYVDKKLNLYTNNLVILYTDTIYYESGVVIPEHIAPCDVSCGGNYYRRDFIIKNNLFPHENLKMDEDEYFNNILDTFLMYCNTGNEYSKRYSYPTYEVHHDDWDLSFAHSNWVDYVIKYHLLSAQYYINFFQTIAPHILKHLINDDVYAFIFTYYNFMCLLQDPSVEMVFEEQIKVFQEALIFFLRTFHYGKKFLLEFFEMHPTVTQAIRKNAIETTGITQLNERYSFAEFLEFLKEYDDRNNDIESFMNCYQFTTV